MDGLSATSSSNGHPTPEVASDGARRFHAAKIEVVLADFVTADTRR